MLGKTGVFSVAHLAAVRALRAFWSLGLASAPGMRRVDMAITTPVSIDTPPSHRVVLANLLASCRVGGLHSRSRMGRLSVGSGSVCRPSAKDCWVGLHEVFQIGNDLILCHAFLLWQP